MQILKILIIRCIMMKKHFKSITVLILILIVLNFMIIAKVTTTAVMASPFKMQLKVQFINITPMKK